MLRLPAGGLPRARAELKHATLEGRGLIANRPVFPMLHPAFILRSETWAPILRQDFKRLARWIKEGGLELQDLGEHIVTQDVDRLYQLGPTISLDVETTMSGSPLTAKLLCVGMSDGATTVVLWPWSPRLAPKLSQFLHSRAGVIGHNLFQFDRVVLERHGVL